MHARYSNHKNHGPRRAKARWRARALVVLFASAFLTTVHAETARPLEPKTDRPSEIGDTTFANARHRLTMEELDESRGGFSTPDGFDFSFGLTNITQVNDEPLIRQQLVSANDVIGGLAGNTATIRSSPRTGSGNPVVFQLGANNHIAPSVLAQGTGLPNTIIQNSLDNQHIRNTNVYDFQLDNVGALTRALNQNLHRAALSQRLVDSIR